MEKLFLIDIRISRLARNLRAEDETMIPIPRSQRLTMIANERAASADWSRFSEGEFLQDEDFEKDPFVYNHLKTELSVEA